jgi:hypothetical protein
MIDTILDFSIDHAAAFIAIFSLSVVTVVGGGIWAYGRFHERATRRRESGIAS